MAGVLGITGPRGNPVPRLAAVGLNAGPIQDHVIHLSRRMVVAHAQDQRCNYILHLGAFKDAI